MRKIRDTDLEIVKLTAKELLLTIFDLTTPFYQAHWRYRKSINNYLDNRIDDRRYFLDRIRYLKRHGLIETFIEGKDKFAELTPKGIKVAKNYLFNNIKIKRPDKWDGKWRIIIFDVPEKVHQKRDFLRDNLVRHNFVQIQKSVYVYPFECTQEVSFFAQGIGILKYVVIMIAEIIQGETKIIEKFLDCHVLNLSDLKRKK